MSLTPPRSASLLSPAALAEAGLVTAQDAAGLGAVAARYAVAVTGAMAALIDTADPADPIARQFIPSLAELDYRPEEMADPIGDEAHSPVEGIVHRYADRALLKILHACPVYCRFCFRREMVGPSRPALTGAKLEAALAYIAATPALWEIILTGGDPFMLSARRARDLTRRLAAIPHVRTLRWHTRVPIVDPERVTAEFVRALTAPGLTTIVAIHANHPREITAEAQGALARLADAGVMLVSQSVLLKGVNDTVETLEALMRRFVENRVKPYYLHHPDLAPGTAHFRLDIGEGQALMAALRQRLSGLALPHYMLDLPGAGGKVPLERGHVGPPQPDGTRLILDRAGRAHAYPPRRQMG